MKSIIASFLLISLLVIVSCADKVQVFTRHSDVEEAGLKGKVKSIVIYQCSLGDSVEHCSAYRKEFNAQGFLTDKFDTIGNYFSSYKYSYNKDGLLEKVIFSSNDSFMKGDETYYTYSISERKKTEVMRRGTKLLDSIIHLYDRSGNEINWTTGNTKAISNYDKHGFLIAGKLIKGGDTMGTSYVNDDKGRVLKASRSDSIEQSFVYDKDGNRIQEGVVDPSGKRLDYLAGYCKFDQNGNYLESITACKQKKETFMTRRVIEYY
ncbi:MAG: hypothetical protein BGO69_13075 [Bacteroidetes bacterium 46-16]|nr:MAG: hypothetical protein BGO69_13075 [Bacteroidetes bacterium 46-16]